MQIETEKYTDKGTMVIQKNQRKNKICETHKGINTIYKKMVGHSQGSAKRKAH